MSLSEFVAQNVARIVALREGGKTWDEVATLIGSEIGEAVNVASLKKAFARATPEKVAPASVEKPLKRKAAARPAEIVKPVAKPDPAEGLRAALAASETRAAEALSERDSARAEVAKTEQDRDRLRVEIEGLKAEINEVKKRAETGEEEKPDGEKDGGIDALRAELLQARKTVDQWERWSEDRINDVPPSRPIMVAAMVFGALLIGAGVGGYGSRFLADHRSVEVASVAQKPTSTETEAEPTKAPFNVQEKRAFDRPAGLPPLPPRPSTEGALTGRKTISLLD